tara:strand:- start:2867 stop:3493 length:627 start_codon:yes stop_codon:yes gene_type:complete
MAAPRYNGNGFTNPLNPISLHAENHYRAEYPIGDSFMSDERRIFNAIKKKTVKAGAKKKAKTAAKISAKTSKKRGAKAATKAAFKAAQKSSRAALKSATPAIKAGLKGASKNTVRLATVGIIVYGGYKALTDITGTNLGGKLLGEQDCEAQADELYDPTSEEYTAYLENCYAENAESFVNLGRYALIAGGVIGSLILVMIFKPKKTSE